MLVTKQIRLWLTLLQIVGAATPTAAAELATPVSKADTLVWIRERQNRAYQACLRRIQYNQERLAKLSQSVVFRTT